MSEKLTQEIENKILDSAYIQTTVDLPALFSDKIVTIEIAYIPRLEKIAIGDLSGDSDIIGTGSNFESALAQWYVKKQIKEGSL